MSFLVYKRDILAIHTESRNRARILDREEFLTNLHLMSKLMRRTYGFHGLLVSPVRADGCLKGCLCFEQTNQAVYFIYCTSMTLLPLSLLDLLMPCLFSILCSSFNFKSSPNSPCMEYLQYLHEWLQSMVHV